MPLKIVRADITKFPCDAVVNAANESLLGGGGVDGAIHRAAGSELYKECLALGGCRTGEAKITSGCKMPCRYIIHTVGPIWRGGDSGEKQLLESCYRNSLSLALKNGCESVAFPMISAGVYGYPKEQAFRVASDTILDFLATHEQADDMTVYIVIFDSDSFLKANKLFSDIESYIDDNYAQCHTDEPAEKSRRLFRGKLPDTATTHCFPTAATAHKKAFDDMCVLESEAETQDGTLEDALGSIDESFSQMLLRKIDESGMKDSECYKKANIDRKLFSKIRSNIDYKPSKPTAVAFAIALGLSLPETAELLMKAGYALSHSNKFDIIIEYFIKNNIYDIITINETLFSYNQMLLGA